MQARCKCYKSVGIHLNSVFQIESSATMTRVLAKTQQELMVAYKPVKEEN